MEAKVHKYAGCSDLRKEFDPAYNYTVKFDSIAAARNVAELIRAPGATVVATGTVKKVYKDWLLLEFRSGVRETASRTDIISIVRGKRKKSRTRV